MPTVTSRDGTTIAYSTWGRGPALVLVDGAFCFRDNGPTPRLAPELATAFTVYAYDRRGRGDSTDTAPYAVEPEIDDLAAVVAAAGGPVGLVGLSSGGALVVRALASGVPATGAVLYEVPYVAADPAATPPPVTAGRDLTALVEAGRRGAAVRYFLTRVLGAPRPAVTGMRLMARRAWARNESVARTLLYDLELMGDWRVPPQAAGIRVPTLVMSGGKAPQALRRAADALAAAIPDAGRAGLPGQGHNVDAAVLAPRIVDFLTGPATPDRG